MNNFCFSVSLAGQEVGAAVFGYMSPHLLCLTQRLLCCSPVHLYPAAHARAGSFLPCFLQVLCHRHTTLLSGVACSQKMAVLYTRDKTHEAGRTFRSKEGGQREFLVWAQERCLNRRTSFYRYLVDGRWCSSITGTVTKFCSGSFSEPLPVLSSQQMQQFKPCMSLWKKKNKPAESPSHVMGWKIRFGWETGTWPQLP